MLLSHTLVFHSPFAGDDGGGKWKSQDSNIGDYTLGNMT